MSSEAASRKKVLVAQPDPVFRELLVLALESAYGVTALEASSVQDARAVSLEGLDLVLADSSFHAWVRELPQRIPVVLSVTDAAARLEEAQRSLHGRPIQGKLDQPYLIESMLEVARPYLEARDPDEFCRIRVETLLRVGILPRDVYLRLSDDKHVRVMRQGDTFVPGDLSRFAAKKITYLYLKAEDARALAEQFARELQHLSELKTAPEGSLILMSQAALETIHQLVASLGVSPEVRKLAQASVDLAIVTAGRHRRLQDIAASFSSNDGSYIPLHSIMVAHVACALSSMMGWSTDTIFHKLAFAAIFHDISIRSDRLAALSSLDDLAVIEESLNPEEIADVINHPAEGSLLLGQLENIPRDAVTVVLQHHERPDGSGFPERLKHDQIHPLSTIFNIAHDLVSQVIGDERGWSLSRFIHGEAALYGEGFGHRVLSELALASASGEI